MGAMEEPFPGWVDNVNGASSFLAGALYGVLRGIHAEDDAVADFVPCDLVVNQIITAAWDIAQRGLKEFSTFLQVFTVSVLEFWDFCILHEPIKAFENLPVHHVTPKFCTINISFIVVQFHSHVSKAGLTPRARITRLVRLQSAYTRGMHHSRFVTTRHWSFGAGNAAALGNRLVGEDRTAFSSDASVVNWPDYFERCALGLRRFYFKQNPETLPEARKDLIRLRWVYFTAQAFLFLSVLAIGALAFGRLGPEALLFATALMVVLRAL
ncbi:hypothetical protein J437_LFUL012819 [Ladona fulva]|uniref:Fatty acyl-CoA reductase n=1 Tax=Ladona fulva TaxID=123851 RepID=A0A8K0KFU0_LADFU|nr:hypothetical protein J437_LFUL012819 [Ladona fulva]